MSHEGIGFASYAGGGVDIFEPAAQVAGAIGRKTSCPREHAGGIRSGHGEGERSLEGGVEYPEMVTVALAEASGKSRDSTVTSLSSRSRVFGAVKCLWQKSCRTSNAAQDAVHKPVYIRGRPPVTVAVRRLRIGGARGHYARVSVQVGEIVTCGAEDRRPPT